MRAHRKTWAMILWVTGCMVKSDAHLLSGLQSNYCDVHRPYGTMDDVDRLISELKLRNMKLIMDLVVNHTSDQVRPFNHSFISSFAFLSLGLINKLNGTAPLVH